MFEKRISSLKRIGPHNLDILEIIIGSLLGDGSMEISKEDLDFSSYRFAFSLEKPNGEFLLWLHAEISKLGYCKPNIPQIMCRKGVDGSLRYIFRFRTYSYSSFSWIYESFYTTNTDINTGKTTRRKIIPTFLSDYLTPKAIAIWIMDDGTYIKDRGLRFCTNSFTLNEVKFLGSILDSKYNLSFTIHKTGVVNQYGLYLPKKNLEPLIKIVKPYIHPTMLYKLGLVDKFK